MKEGEVQKTLDEIEGEFDKGNYGAARNLGFWRVVKAAKEDPALSDRFADRIGAIDKRLFESKSWVKLDYNAGTLIELLGALSGVVILYLALTSRDIYATILYLASAIVLMTALHPISHSIAARLFGIRFHFYFLNGPLLIEPTLKVDYATYVKTPAKRRAIFHLAGAINSTLVTLLVLLVAVLDKDSSDLTKLLLAAFWLFTASSEVFPLIFTKIGVNKILFADWRKTDSYRALREWKLIG
jgi:hypothetical protein